jgi:thiamine-monophosphate kinase
LSDLAAMTAEPLGALLSMALDPARASIDAPELQKGVAEACRAQGIRILGGDLARSPGPLVLDVVVLGRSDSPVLRSGSEAGDEVWVTGWLGGSGGAVALWTEGVLPPDSLRNAFVHPRPRIREARWLASRAPLHALIDISDGLAGDSGHLAAASALALVLREASIPLHPEIQGLSARGHDPLHFALRGGEDYELCLTVPPRTLDEWVGPFQDSFGIPLTKVGWVRAGQGVYLETVGGGVGPLENLGFSHFSGEEEG